MNKRQKKKFEKKGEMKKFTINFNARIAEYNYAASVDIKNGKLKNWNIINNGKIIRNYHLTKYQRKQVIFIARQMYRMQARCVDFTPGFRGDPYDMYRFPPQSIRYYRYKYPSFCDYLNDNIKGE